MVVTRIGYKIFLRYFYVDYSLLARHFVGSRRMPNCLGMHSHLEKRLGMDGPLVYSQLYITYTCRMQGNHRSFASLSCGCVLPAKGSRKSLPPTRPHISLFTDLWKKYMGGCNGIKLELNRCLQQEASLSKGERISLGHYLHQSTFSV